MTPAALSDRALAHYPGGRARFDPITILILSSILAAVIGHYVERWLSACENRKVRNPSVWAAFQLRWRVSRAWRSPEFAAAILQARHDHPEWDAQLAALDLDTLDRDHTGDVTRALLTLAANLSDAEIAAALGRST